MDIEVKDSVIRYGTRVVLIAYNKETGEVEYTRERDIQYIRVYDAGGCYFIINTKTGELLSDNDGQGYKTANEAIEELVASWYEDALYKGERNHIVRSWLDSHKSYSRVLESLIDNNGADEGYINEFFRSNGIKVEFEAVDLLRVLGVKKESLF